MNRQEEYSIRRRAAQDLADEMQGRGREHEARKARLLVDSLDVFYSDIAGARGASPVELTNPYVKEDYDKARIQIVSYLKGGEMPWLKHRRTRKERQAARKMAGLNLTLGVPIKKKPLAVDMKIDLSRKHDKRETRKQLSSWRDWGTITSFVYTSTGKTFRFEGYMTLAEGKYMIKSEDGRHLAIQDLLLEPEQFEPPLVELGLNFEKRHGGQVWGGYIR